MDKLTKHRQYVKKHKENVKKAWDRLKSKIECKGVHYWNIDIAVDEHDNSKLLEGEVQEYANWFYPDKPEERDEDEFKKAWMHHVHNNPHHWEHWVGHSETGDAYEMSFEYIIEMILDWQAMSYDLGGTIVEFYEFEKDRMILHPNTRKFIDDHIKEYSEYMKEIGV